MLNNHSLDLNCVCGFPLHFYPSHFFVWAAHWWVHTSTKLPEVLVFLWFSQRKPLCVCLENAPLKGCIVWTLCKAKLVQSNFNREARGRCSQVCVCNCSCMLFHLPQLETNDPLFSLYVLQNTRAVLRTWPWSRQLVYGSSSICRWCSHVTLCVSSWLLVTVHFCRKLLLSMHSYLLRVLPTIWPL